MNWKKYSSVILLFLACAFFVLSRPSIAKTDVVYANYKYVMGDNDTKSDAKRICFLEAKRRCLEKVGTYIESETEVKNYKLTKDEVRTYAAALTKVEVVNEEIKFEGESIAIFMTVKAEVDMDSVNSQLARIMQNKSHQNKLKEQDIRLQELERKYNELQKQLDVAKPSNAATLRKDRAYVLDEIENLGLRYKTVRQEMATRHIPRVEKVKRIVTYTEIGMTPEDVEYILGPGEKKDKQIFSLGEGYEFLNPNNLYYDDVIIRFSTRDTVEAIDVICRYSNPYGVPIKTASYNIYRDGINNNPMMMTIRRIKASGHTFANEHLYRKCLSEINNYVFGP